MGWSQDSLAPSKWLTPLPRFERGRAQLKGGLGEVHRLLVRIAKGQARNVGASARPATDVKSQPHLRFAGLDDVRAGRQLANRVKQADINVRADLKRGYLEQHLHPATVTVGLHPDRTKAHLLRRQRRLRCG